MRSFVKTKPSGNSKITLLSTDISESCPSFANFLWCIYVFKCYIRENKIPVKISKFTLFCKVVIKITYSVGSKISMDTISTNFLRQAIYLFLACVVSSNAQ